VAAGIAGTGAGAGVGIGWLTGRGHDAQRVGAVADGRVRGRMSGAGEYARARADDGGAAMDSAMMVGRQWDR
jgi:hypothetical protein